MIPIITIEGATASGKSELAKSLAQRLDTEIVSADSRQVYKYLDIGTAKPDHIVRSQVTHHLIDIITPDKSYSAGAFVRDASSIIESLWQRGKIPIICGGTMLYIKSLLHGISKIPEVPLDVKKNVATIMKTYTLSENFEKIKQIDPAFASRISPTDKQRIFRALEVWHAFGVPITSYWQSQDIEPRYTPFKIYVDRDRDDLYHRINARMQDMIQSGLLQEIKGILDRGYSAQDYGLNTVGYKEFLGLYRDGGVFTSDATEIAHSTNLAMQHTRNYAKRQLTWYRRSKFDFVCNGGESEADYLVNIVRSYSHTLL